MSDNNDAGEASEKEARPASADQCDGKTVEDAAIEDFEWGFNPVTTAAFKLANLIAGKGRKGRAKSVQEEAASPEGSEKGSAPSPEIPVEAPPSSREGPEEAAAPSPENRDAEDGKESDDDDS